MVEVKTKSLSILGDNLNEIQFNRLNLNNIVYEFLDRGRTNNYTRYNSIFYNYIDKFGLQAALLGSFDCYLFGDKDKSKLLVKDLDYGEEIKHVLGNSYHTLINKTDTILFFCMDNDNKLIQIAKEKEKQILLFDYTQGKFIGV